ncbi:unnamed protein product [Caenorhabditis auriculariae]|uniref:CUB domain-containing protein n=1 Tax=Caenorhabditis auriculariae TaxID=2777116 RepID=A0A8S1GPE2_9PELO|nr:unnamed protein product [Caenorhabditis auriculariae]
MLAIERICTILAAQTLYDVEHYGNPEFQEGYQARIVFVEPNEPMTNLNFEGGHIFKEDRQTTCLIIDIRPMAHLAILLDIVAMNVESGSKVEIFQYLKQEKKKVFFFMDSFTGERAISTETFDSNFRRNGLFVTALNSGMQIRVFAPHGKKIYQTATNLSVTFDRKNNFFCPDPVVELRHLEKGTFIVPASPTDSGCPFLLKAKTNFRMKISYSVIGYKNVQIKYKEYKMRQEKWRYLGIGEEYISHTEEVQIVVRHQKEVIGKWRSAVNITFSMTPMDCNCKDNVLTISATNPQAVFNSSGRDLKMCPLQKCPVNIKTSADGLKIPKNYAATLAVDFDRVHVGDCINIPSYKGAKPMGDFVHSIDQFPSQRLFNYSDLTIDLHPSAFLAKQKYIITANLLIQPEACNCHGMAVKSNYKSTFNLSKECKVIDCRWSFANTNENKKMKVLQFTMSGNSFCSSDFITLIETYSSDKEMFSTSLHLNETNRKLIGYGKSFFLHYKRNDPDESCDVTFALEFSDQTEVKKNGYHGSAIWVFAFLLSTFVVLGVSYKILRKTDLFKIFKADNENDDSREMEAPLVEMTPSFFLCEDVDVTD